MRGGYDEGYASCPCFWGVEPGSLVLEWLDCLDPGSRVLDLGCGEGKNAAYLANRGMAVDAIDISIQALRNGKAAWGNRPEIHWVIADSCRLPIRDGRRYHAVILYGVLHCLAGPDEVRRVLEAAILRLAPGGFVVCCSFNCRDQDLEAAHPGFTPCLMSHDWYLDQLAHLEVLVATDEDLHEAHPHNGIAHHHSLTRIVARRP